MTDKEVMQIALETAEQIAIADYRHWEELASLGEFERWARSRANHIAEALRARLAQPEQKPVAWFCKLPDNKISIKIVGKPTEGNWQPLYTAPPQREWVGLTDEEYEAMAEQYVTNCYFDTLKYAKAIEAKLKEKNT